MSATQPIRHAPVWIVADDLTGACDAAVAFAQRGARTQVLLDAQALTSPGAEVIALSTNTRDMPRDEAIHQLRSDLNSPFLLSSSKRSCVSPGDSAQVNPTIFKKIDSILRGNTFHEIRATLAAFTAYTAILAPAYPAQGRITHHGEVIATDLTGQRIIPFLSDLRSTGIHPTHIPASVDAHDLAGNMRAARLLLCDATEQRHLEAIVTAAAILGQPILWIGSAGLAHALAASLIPTRHSQPLLLTTGRLLALIGSDHPVTLRQLEHLHTQHKAALWTGSAWDDSASIAVMSIERNVTTETQIRKAFEQLASRPAAIFVTGGDTATHVCRALGIHALCLQQEFAPGIPQAIVMGGPCAGTTIILKSGGFGKAHLLTDIARHLQPHEAGLER